jgi:hypothetical protein
VSLIDPHEDASDVNNGEKISCGFLVTAGDRSKAFDVMKEALDIAAQAIKPFGLSPSVVFARRIHCNDGFHSARTNRVDDTIRVVASVGDQRLASRVLNEILCLRRVVLLTRGQRDVEGFALGRRDGVDLGRKTSSRTAQTISLDPPFPPAASWCARTTEPSMSEPTSSTATRSSLKSRSQTPRFAQRLKRLYTVFQLPYRSGISRQGAPVFTRQTTALTKSRSPRLARGPRRMAIRLSIRAHCASLSSCRCIDSVDQTLIAPATTIRDTP